MGKSLYSLPVYYDTAFSWDADYETEVMLRIFHSHSRFQIERLLEPACGTGRFFAPFFRKRIMITGYDISEEMVEYANNQAKESGCWPETSAHVNNMKTANFKEKFHGAFNSINSIGYLLTSEDITDHLKNTAVSIKRGGIYLIHLNCAMKDKKPRSGGVWTEEKNGISVTTEWVIEKEDHNEKRSYQRCFMKITEKGRTFSFEENHVLRLWLFPDIQKHIKDSGVFSLDAVYADNGKEIDQNSDICGEMGNLYYVLKVQ